MGFGVPVSVVVGCTGQHHGRPGLLAEVEVVGQVAEDLLVLTDIGSRVGTTVGGGVDALAVQEVVLDELVVGVEAQKSDGRCTRSWRTG